VSNPWLDRWQQGQIGWHETHGNRGLKTNWSASGRNVLVPLCGKSADLLWLAEKGNRVTGVELSPIAVEAFFAEHGLSFTEEGSAAMPVYAARELPLRLVCGDYFDFEETGFDAHYDRGALVALPPDVRPRYAGHTLERLTPDALQCVITLEYAVGNTNGPPFAVPDAELLERWPRLELRDRYDDSAAMPPKFRDAGVTELYEKVWMTPD